MAQDDTYNGWNGWTNRETWALNLWLSNDQGLYEMTRERVAADVDEHKGDTFYPVYGTDDERRAYEKRVAGEAVKDLWDEITDPSEGLMTAEQILTMVREVGSDYRVDWDEIGAHWLADVTESPVSE